MCTPSKSRQGLEWWCVGVVSCATVSVLGIAAASAQRLSPPSSPPRPPLFTLVASSSTTASIDQSHARHVSPIVTAWQMRVDSTVAGMLFARQPSDISVNFFTGGTMQIPLSQGRMQVPSVVPTPWRLRGTGLFGRAGAVLPLPLAERASQHSVVRDLITYAAAFDGLPTGASTLRVADRDSAGGIALTMTATRRHRMLRDSVVNARPVRLVRDSTTVTLEQTLLVPSRFTNVLARETHSLRGTIVGRRVVDLGTLRTIAMYDTVSLRGRVRTNDGYGGTTDLPHVEYSVRDGTVRDSLSPPFIREPFDIVRTNTSGPAPTAAQRDASVARLLVEPSIRARDSIRAGVRYSRDFAITRRIIAHALTVGDSAAAAQWMTNDLYSPNRPPLTLNDWRTIRRWLFDATAARRVGVDRELMAINLIDGLTQAPPVLSTPTRLPICEPAVCRAIANEVTTSALPTSLPASALPLRAVALVAAMVTTPRDWTDSVIANATRNPLLATRALWFARGTSSTAVASAKAPVPAPNAAARAWRYWLTGQDSVYLQSRVGAALARTPARTSFVNYNTDQVATSLRFAEIRTGQSYTTALHRHRASATDDSTRALFGMLLMAMGEAVFTPSELVALVMGPPSDERALAISQITHMPPGLERPLASDSVAALIGVRVIESLYANRPLLYVGDTVRRVGLLAPPPVVDSVPQYLSMDSVPDVVRQRAAALGHAPVARTWTFPAGATGITTRVSPVRGARPFYSVDVTNTTLYARGGARSGGYANGTTLWFVEGHGGWVVFYASSWVT